MAKPKFELTSELVKVEPEPQTLLQQAIVVAEKVVEVTKTDQQLYVTQPDISAPSNNFVNNHSFVESAPTMQNEAPAAPKEERQSMSLYISKNLKKKFHLHCVHNGLSMTEAIEIAIQKYLDDN